MNRLDELWTQALGDLANGLSRDGANAADVRELIDLLREQHFPGMLALLGAGDGRGPLGSELLERIAGAAALAKGGIDPSTARRLLTAMLVQRATPAELLADANAMQLLAQVATTELANQGIAVRPEEAHKMVELLASGEFFGDVGSATAAILHTLPRLPILLVKDLPQTPFRIVRLAQAVGQDLPSAAFQVPAVVIDLLDGTLDHPPALMKHTFTWLYETATVRSTIEMIRTLIAPENESVRLALVLYARANGIPLEPGDLDMLRDTALNADNPDLGPALNATINRLRSRYSPADLEQVLRRMAS
jgi:hypothetical protein